MSEKKDLKSCVEVVAQRTSTNEKGETEHQVLIRHDPTVCAPKAEHAGPANVTTNDYRDGWDRIFGGKVERGQA